MSLDVNEPTQISYHFRQRQGKYSKNKRANSNSAWVCLQDNGDFVIFTIHTTSVDENINKIVYSYSGKGKGQLGEH